MATILDGLDMHLFASEFGLHDSSIRSFIIAKLAWLGHFDVDVIQADEDAVMIQEAYRIVGAR